MILVLCPNPAIDTFWHLISIEKSQSNKILSEEKYPGGKGVHVALTIAELKKESLLLGIWAGNNGKWIRKKCEDSNVRTDGIEIDGDNRSCITVQSSSAWRDTEFLGTGPLLSEEKYKELCTVFEAYIHQCDVIVLSGSWPPTAVINPYNKFIEKANAYGKKVWLDCTGNNLYSALECHPYGLHLNQKEVLDACNHLNISELELSQKVDKLAITKGKEGLTLYDRPSHKSISGKCELDKIISTVGSGDCLTAGLAIATFENMDQLNSVKLAVACGSANCIRPDLGMLWEKDVERLKKMITIGF